MRWRAALGAPLLAAAIVGIAYGIWLRSYVAGGGDIRTFVHVGRHFIDLQQGTPYAIHLPPGFPVYTDGQSDGYDGQWVYYMARDPLHAYHVLDAPAYRYGRILLPLVVRAVALGHEAAIPGAIVAINLFWLVVGTGALAAWLRRRGQPALLAVAFGLYPGLFVTLQFDLTEVMAYGLVAVSLLLLDVAGPRRRLLAGIGLGLAALTRDLALAFGVAYALAELLRGLSRAEWRAKLPRNLPAALELGAPAILPVLAWQLFVERWLGGSVGGEATHFFGGLPFQGLLQVVANGANPAQEMNVEVVAVPAAICAAVCLYALHKRSVSAEWLALSLNVVVVVFTTRYQWFDFTAAGRISAGVTLAALLFVPNAKALFGTRSWIYACAALWLAPTVTTLLLPDLRYLHHLLLRI